MYSVARSEIVYLLRNPSVSVAKGDGKLVM